MMDLSGADYASAVATEIDRIRIAISSHAATRVGPLAAELGISATAGQALSMLRNLPPSRHASRRDIVEHVYVYQPKDATDAALHELVAADLVQLADDDLTLRARGVEAINTIALLLSAVVDELWAGVAADFGALGAITMNAIDAAAETGGRAFGVLAPLYRPPGISLATEFAETLTPLRFHRFDAHIAAWKDAGLTVEQVQALPEGPQKAEIEAATNTAAAAPYLALSADERSILLDALRSLPA